MFLCKILFQKKSIVNRHCSMHRLHGNSMDFSFVECCGIFLMCCRIELVFLLFFRRTRIESVVNLR